MPLRQLRSYIEGTRQKWKALHMLAFSGVVRPSHVELLYAIPLLNNENESSPFPKNSVTAVRPASLLQRFFELLSWPTKDDRSPWQPSIQQQPPQAS